MIGQRTPKLTKAQEREVYRQITLRDENRCQRCLRNCGAPQRDHRQNRQGQNTTVENGQILGASCHTWKSEHPWQAVAEGWAVPRYADPAVWPAARWIKTEIGTVRKAWVIYFPEQDADGDWWQEITEADALNRMGLAA